MKKYLSLLVVVAAVAGCSSIVGCSTTLPATPKGPVSRAQERAAVDLAKDAWVVAATACVDAAEATGNDMIRQTCAKYLVPAHQLIIDAANAVDMHWSNSAACALIQATQLVAQAAEGLPESDKVRAVAADAVSLTAAMLGSVVCSDAGAGDAANDAGAE